MRFSKSPSHVTVRFTELGRSGARAFRRSPAIFLPDAPLGSIPSVCYARPETAVDLRTGCRLESV
jgi:hypothetical protein